MDGGGVLGLDYGVALQLMTLYNVKKPRDVLEDLQLIEAKATELINDRARSSAKGKKR